MPETKKKSRSNTRQAIIIVVVLTAVVAAAVYFGTSAVSGPGTGNTVNVSLPMIETPLVRPSTGEEFNVRTIFSVKIDKIARQGISDTELSEALTEIMNEMDVEKVLGKGRVEYIQDTATELLNERLAGENATTRAILVDIATDDRVTLTDPANRADGVMRDLFQNMD